MFNIYTYSKQPEVDIMMASLVSEAKLFSDNVTKTAVTFR